MSSEIVIRPWAEDDSIPELTDLLHRAYAIWAEQNIRFTATDQSEDLTRERIEGTFTFVAEQGGRLVGAITLHGQSIDHELVYYNRPGVWYFGQFAVTPQLKRTGLGSRLIQTAEDFARERGATELACDTAEPALALHSYYQRRGFRLVGSHDWAFVNYRSLVFTKHLDRADCPNMEGLWRARPRAEGDRDLKAE